MLRIVGAESRSVFDPWAELNSFRYFISTQASAPCAVLGRRAAPFIPIAPTEAAVGVRTAPERNL